VHDWHTDVHEHHVRPQSPTFSDGFDAVTCLADDAKARLGVEDHSQSRADQSLVIGEHDVDHAGTSASSGTSATTLKPPPKGPYRRRPPLTLRRSASPARP